MKRLIAGVIALAVIGALGWLIYQRATEQPDLPGGPGRRAVAVETHPVVRRNIHNVAQFTGTLIPDSHVVVAPKVSGRLEELAVNIGDMVRNGDLIAVLDSAEYDQDVAQATAELQVAEANLADSRSNLDLARRDFERAQQLREERVISESDLDQARAKYEAAVARHQVDQAQIKQRQAALEAARVRQSYTRIHATWTGDESPRLVAQRYVDAGTMLRANDPIVSIVDIDPVTAVIYAIERDYPHIDVGQEATVHSDARPERTFTGLVARKAPVLREQSRQGRVEVEIPNSEHLLAPGMFVRVNIELEMHEDAVAIPSAALSRRNGQQGVFVVGGEGKKVSFVRVTTGISEGPWVEIVEPELTGEVVTLGHHLLEDGADVTVVGSDTGTQGDTGGARP
ncbi:MAG: efflux RND transporter periplasmic adaptor subunit [Phycisphaerae bacterium]